MWASLIGNLLPLMIPDKSLKIASIYLILGFLSLKELSSLAVAIKTLLFLNLK